MTVETERLIRFWGDPKATFLVGLNILFTNFRLMKVKFGYLDQLRLK